MSGSGRFRTDGFELQIFNSGHRQLTTATDTWQAADDGHPSVCMRVRSIAETASLTVSTFADRADGASITVSCDYADPAKRQFADGLRYRVCMQIDRASVDFASDDIDAIRAKIDEWLYDVAEFDREVAQSDCAP